MSLLQARVPGVVPKFRSCIRCTRIFPVVEDALVCPGCRRPPRTDVFRGDPLTPREQAVVRILLLQGCANKAIAEDLRVSLHTVKAHLRNIFTKMGVTSRTELCIMALKNPAIIPPEPPKILPGP